MKIKSDYLSRTHKINNWDTNYIMMFLPFLSWPAFCVCLYKVIGLN